MKRAYSIAVGLMACFCAVMLCAESVTAAIIHVPADQPTIQAAVDAAAVGDSIEVSPGTYSGPGNRDIDFQGKELSVHGQGPDQTIMDCGGSVGETHIGFNFHTAEDSSLVAGLSILNAYSPKSYGDYNSGAIFCNGASPDIQGCTLRDNHTNGILVTGSSAPKLVNLKISLNDGWGIWMPGYPYLSKGVEITQCQVDHNALGGVTVTRAIESTLVARNTIVENGGDGLFLQGDLPRSAITAVWDSSTIIEQNIMAFNTGRGMYAMGFFPGIHYYRNDLFGNAAGDAVGIGGDIVCNISTDPLFCRQAGLEYMLSFNSGCLAWNNICIVSMGAYGEGCHSCCVGTRGNVDCDPANGIDISDLSRLIDNLYISFDRLCCEESANTDAEAGIDISDISRLIDYLYISFAPLANCP